jgi:hypothetical protein
MADHGVMRWPAGTRQPTYTQLAKQYSYEREQLAKQ